MAAAPAKLERLEVMVTAEQKALIQRAADLIGEPLEEFIAYSLEAAAQEMIRQKVITLSPRDSIRFVEAILNPGEPNERLCKAAEDYYRFIGEEP